MSAAAFDLGLRLRAAADQHPVARRVTHPCAIAPHVVAVTATGRGAALTATVHTAASTVTVQGARAVLSALATAGVDLSTDEPPGLLVEDRRTLPALLSVARTISTDDALWPSAAAVGWWADRADIPGTSAVLNVPVLCAQAWATGAPPAAERHPRHWRRWLRARDTLDLWDRLLALDPAPLLRQIRADDEHSWNSWRDRASHDGGWRQHEHHRDAAVNLAVRCAAADVIAAATLTDPLGRVAAVHTGDVVSGTVLDVTDARLTLAVTRIDGRLRRDSPVEAFIGPPDRAVNPNLSGRVAGSAVAPDGTGLLTLRLGRASSQMVGSTVTVLPQRASMNAVKQARYTYGSLYGQRGSWLVTGKTPVPHRRDVPLEVLAAAAAADREDKK